MSKGKYERKRCYRRRAFGGKSLALVLALVLLVGGVVSGTLAWLTAESDDVTNVFTTSDIGVQLAETTTAYKMVPGWTIDKDPKVTVEAGSEDCWLFVKITESTNLDDYIVYAIASGWEVIQAENENGEIVIGRKVYKDDTTKEFGILGGGTYNFGDVDYSWGENEVLTKPEVTEEMMEAVKNNNQPTLSFTAYAVQLFKTNSDGVKTNIGDEFTAAEAWARVPIT